MISVGQAIVIAFLTFIAGAVIIGVLDATSESDHCKKLEQKIGINLVYTYNGGCQRAEDV